MTADSTSELFSVSCPCCDEPLYFANYQELHGELFWMRSEDAKLIERDAQGTHMKCPHCAKRIAVRILTHDPSLRALVGISKEQKC